MKGEPTIWVVELTVKVSVNVHMSVEFLALDPIDKDELSLGSRDVIAQEEIEVDIYLTCADVRLETPVIDWDTDIEIADGSYSLEGFEVSLDYGSQDD